MLVELQNASDQTGLPDAASIKRWVALTLLRAGDTPAQQAELCVRFVDIDEGAQLNLQFRNIDKATNVLSFPADVTIPTAEHATGTMTASDDKVPRLLGDLVICGPVLAQEALAQGKALADHTTHLVIHGVLHLLGYDHETDSEAQAMEGLEIAILAELGVANPYIQVAELASAQVLS